MDFLDKLYSNDYFGIGLFIIIAFLVVAFLIVLFFGKKDEKKRKLEETNKLNTIDNTTDGFKEESTPTPVEIPISNLEPNLEPVAPITLEPNNNYSENTPIDKIPEEVTPITLEPNNNLEQNIPVEPIINPVTIEPVTLVNTEEDSLTKEEEVIEPINLDTPSDSNNTPIIEEEIKPIVLNTIDTPQLEEVKIEPATFYHEPEKVEAKPIEVPNIDFDAIAKSISQELDDLEKNNSQKINVAPQAEPKEQFSSVYVNNAAKVNTIPKTKIVLPKKIELPEVKQNEEVEPESYQI